jgi:hypothetical protein
MRGLTILVVILAGLWSGWWVLASTAAERGAQAAVDQLRAEGWEVAYQDLSVTGFPNRVDTIVQDLRLTDPVSGFAWEAPLFQVYALSYRPTEVIADWPATQDLTVMGERLTVASEGMRASASVAAALDLPLNQITAESGPLTVTAASGWTLGADRMLAAFRAAGPGLAGYDAYLDADAVALPAPLRAWLDPQGRLPAVAEGVTVDAHLTFDRPLDRHLQGQAALVGLDLRQAEAVWGPVRLAARGDLVVGPDGVPQGRITLSVTGWAEVIALATAAGAVTPDVAPTLVTMGETLAQGGPVVELPLSFENGMMSLGFIPLGPAPRLAPPDPT